MRIRLVASGKELTRQAILEHDGEREVFGLHYGEETWTLNREELHALIDGKTLARDINDGEYTCFLRLEG